MIMIVMMSDLLGQFIVVAAEASSDDVTGLVGFDALTLGTLQLSLRLLTVTEVRVIRLPRLRSTTTSKAKVKLGYIIIIIINEKI